MILWKEGATQAQEDEAHAILEVLDTAYPGHPWGVRVYPGGFFIRHMDFDGNHGMNCRAPTSVYTSSALKRQIILMAGEWLERAGIARGRWDPEQDTKYVEGVPDRFQPAEYQQQLKDKKLDLIVAKAIEDGALRSEPMPQVAKEGGDA
jgi:hypothetical protein